LAFLFLWGVLGSIVFSFRRDALVQRVFRETADVIHGT
jgi:hypothetical protein